MPRKATIPGHRSWPCRRIRLRRDHDTTKGDGASLVWNALHGPHVHVVDSPGFSVTRTMHLAELALPSPLRQLVEAIK